MNTFVFFFRPECKLVSRRFACGSVLLLMLIGGVGLCAGPLAGSGSATETGLAAVRFHALRAFPLDAADDSLAIRRPVRAHEPFTVAGERGMLVGREAGSFEAWILPIKLLSHMAITAQIEGYPVPIDVNEQAASIQVHPDHTVITYAHIGFTLRQIMFSPSEPLDAAARQQPETGPVVLFQVDARHAVDLTFRFTPEMLWMWPKRNGGVPSPEWVAAGAGAGAAAGASAAGGYYVLHLDYPDLAGAVTIPGAEPGVMAPYQERPQVHPLELHLHYDPKRDGDRYFPLLMAMGATPETATNAALGRTLARLNERIPALYASEQAAYGAELKTATRITTPDARLNRAFGWAEVSVEQLKAHGYDAIPGAGETALVAGYYESGDSARPGFGWFFGRDALYASYAVDAMGDFALTREELEFLARRQRADGKIMHEYSQTAYDPEVHWRSFPYMYAAADATPLFLLAVRDYLRSSGDVAWVKAHGEAIEKAWAFETAPTSDTDHDGIYDNSQGTGWVESWPGGMPHQEVYLALLDEEASVAYGELARALGHADAARQAESRAVAIRATIEREYADGGCYAFSHGMDGRQDRTRTVFPAVAWWDEAADMQADRQKPVDQAESCLREMAAHTLETDWGLRDVASDEPIFDGMSYHQGSVWPLFTGWAAMAEYRGGQPLAGEQMLRENVNLTWASDLGAVTELLSGDTYVPFGRSTSHQLWSSAMVIEPVMRGMLGITPEATQNALIVDPHLPANWPQARVDHLHLGSGMVSIAYERRQDGLHVTATSEQGPVPTLRSDLPGARTLRSDLPGARMLRGDLPGARILRGDARSAEMLIPLPAVEVVEPVFELPEAGARSFAPRVLEAEYAGRSLKLTLEAPAGSEADYALVVGAKTHPAITAQSGGARLVRADDGSLRLHAEFAPGTGWQRMSLTLGW